jgi:hypothetical protein
MVEYGLPCLAMVDYGKLWLNMVMLHHGVHQRLTMFDYG